MTTAPDSSRVAVLLAWARARLAGIEASNPAQESVELLEWAAGASRWTMPDPVGDEARKRFLSGVQRRAAREPVQHITARMHFRGLVLAARPGVFICRPETEVVAGLAVDAARAMGPRPRVVDLCTGSGAIALAVATEAPSCEVVAVEIDEAAAALARINIDALAPGRVRLLRADAADPQTLADLDGTVDVVVSNPPYVPAAESPVQPEALVDPPLALYGGGEEGMDAPRRILATAARLLRPGGVVVVEHSPSQAEQMRREARAAGFADARTEPDLAGASRALVARRATMPR
ncbi:peptide chain release factor N(5)-glutamine methyltransferase [Actinomyces sp. B33]|uniref:peptide chain release factor N(5)-glutamine methyltransferase n=1 Tax=Actinomyces sp. B33 TaxID=2942131 RepID=UPI00234219AF|nr:peptide chain release factor N(5)-glutamine methyltransferase [Actinomyces sp. B33]MDC4232849.1 peptide chain release factor N(5)-glutamine methyltransferase [Actinomyces sp. B33]